MCLPNLATVLNYPLAVIGSRGHVLYGSEGIAGGCCNPRLALEIRHAPSEMESGKLSSRTHQAK